MERSAEWGLAGSDEEILYSTNHHYYFSLTAAVEFAKKDSLPAAQQ